MKRGDAMGLAYRVLLCVWGIIVMGRYWPVAGGWPKAVAGLRQLLESGTAGEAQKLWVAEAQARLLSVEPVRGPEDPRRSRTEEDA